jgi:hypothetical protein
MAVQGANAPVFGVTTADHGIDVRFALQRVKHTWQQLLVMLQVGIHYRDIRRAARQDSFHAGGSKPPAVNSLYATHPPVLTGKSVDHLSGTIVRVVIDKDRLPVDALQRPA